MYIALSSSQPSPMSGSRIAIRGTEAHAQGIDVTNDPGFLE